MTLFMVMGGLLILTLILASIAQRYHAYLEERRRQIERILRRVEELESLQQSLQGLPVAPEVIALLRRDILARLRVIKQVHSRYPGIDGRIGQAAQLLQAGQTEVAPVELDERVLEGLMRGLGQVEWMLLEGRFVVPVAEDERNRLLQSIGMQRAEILFGFHGRLSRRLMEEGQLHQALWHCDQAREFLRDKAPDNEKTRNWYQEIDQRRREITAQLGGQPSESPSEPPP